MLRDSGWEVIHAADADLSRALDGDLMRYARERRLAVVGYRYDLEPHPRV